MTRLQDLYQVEGQSPWVDDLKRSYVVAGGLDRLIGEGVRGVTSNPTIMANSIEGGSDYDEQFAALTKEHMSVEDAYWELVLQDVTGALDIFRPLYDASKGTDGFVSVEVAPSLAHDSAATLAAARTLHERVNRPNVLIKIPATLEGLSAIETMISEGRSVNVTLIFSIERYEAVIEAYISGLEKLIARGGDPTPVASVASFFVSRVDTEIDRRLNTIAEGEPGTRRAQHALELRGKAAVAQAKVAYEVFTKRFAEPRFTALAARGAAVQRPLWASTSTKNPAYSDLLYVDNLIAPSTVNTMPPATLEAFNDHGNVERSADVDLDAAHATLAGLVEVGVDLTEVTDQLETEGVHSFAKSFEELIAKLHDKAAALGSTS